MSIYLSYVEVYVRFQTTHSNVWDRGFESQSRQGYGPEFFAFLLSLRWDEHFSRKPTNSL
jgi:hypothetical protein